MIERDNGRGDPETLLEEVKQCFRQIMLENQAIATVFKDLLEKDKAMSLEPYSNSKEYGIYAEARSQFIGIRSGRKIDVAYGRHFPILIKDSNGNFTEPSPAFIQSMQELDFSEDDINKVILLFEANAEKVKRVVPLVLLESEPLNFTWRVFRG